MLICSNLASKPLCQTASNADDTSKNTPWAMLFEAMVVLIEWIILSSCWAVLSAGKYAACWAVIMLFDNKCLNNLLCITLSVILLKVGKIAMGL